MLVARRLARRLPRPQPARGRPLSSDHDEAPVDSYWTDMDRRVSRRKPRERGDGVKQGRGTVPKTEADFWLAAGLYDAPEDRSSAAARRPARLSRVAIKKGELDAARATYERAVLPVLRASGALVTASLLVDDEASTLTALSTWRDDGAFAAVAATPEYGAAIAELVAHFRDADGVPASVDVGHYAYDDGGAPE